MTSGTHRRNKEDSVNKERSHWKCKQTNKKRDQVIDLSLLMLLSCFSRVRLFVTHPMDCSLPGSSIHGIFQARVLEWGAIAFSEILVWNEVKVAKSCPTLCNSIDCSPPDSSIHGILQVSILEWVAYPFSSGSFWPRNWTQVSCIVSRFFTS